MWWETLVEALLDTLKLFPFLLLLYILIELMEHNTRIGRASSALSGRWAPLVGGATGLVPMCGFSVMAAKLYEKRYVTIGTLLAVFITTSVEAVDGNFATSVRVWNFSKKETVIAFQFAQPEETDARATKILITPTWHIEGSVAKVEACNNAFDASPAWEDITAQVAINRVYNFLNQSKTAEKWGVNVRFTIEKNEGYEGEVSISGFGGAYE